MKQLLIVLLVMCGLANNSFSQKNAHYKTRTTKSSVIRAIPATPAVPGISSARPAIPASPARKRSDTYYSTTKKGHAYGHLKNKSGKK